MLDNDLIIPIVAIIGITAMVLVALPGGGEWSGMYAGSATAINNTTDLTPPTVSIISPTSGSFVLGPVTITAVASDNVGVYFVQFFSDGVSLGSDYSAPYTFTTTLSPGTHSLTAFAVDVSDNGRGSSAVIVYTNSSPVCGNGIVEAGEQCDAGANNGACPATCSPSCAVNVCGSSTYYFHDVFEVNDGTGKLTEFMYLTADAPSRIVVFQEVISGVRIVATTTNNQFTITYQGTDYTGSFDPVSQGIQVPGSQAGPLGDDPVAIGRTFVLDEWDGTSTYVTYSGIDTTQNLVKFIINGAQVNAMYFPRADGNAWFALPLKGYHYAGKIYLTYYNQIELERSNDAIPPDAIPPQVSLIAPANGAQWSGWQTFVVTASDNPYGSGVGGVLFFVDNTNIGNNTTGLSSTYAFRTDVSQFAVGTHSAKAIAYDNAGNTQTSTSNTFTVIGADTTPPVMTIGSPTGIIYVNNSSTAFSMKMVVNTDEVANCKYGTSATQSYANLPSKLLPMNTARTSFSATVTAKRGVQYNYYVRCQDAARNANTSPLKISFKYVKAS